MSGLRLEPSPPAPARPLGGVKGKWTKSDRVLAFVALHVAGVRRVDIVREVCRMADRPFCRGFWSAQLTGGYGREGILRRYCIKGPKGRWRIHDVGRARLAALPAVTFEDKLILTAVASEDVGPIRALVDFWLERGDPRGEVIALDLQRWFS